MKTKIVKGCAHLELGRRQFLRGGMIVTAAAATGIGAPGTAAALPGARLDYPSRRLANLAELQTDVPKDIHYPDADSPGVLVKFGKPVPGGGGPDHDIVAFSTLCPHKGHGLAYSRRDKTLNCAMHFSRFDGEKEGQQVWGHATQNLPMIRLVVEANGDILAVGVDELIYGRSRNILEG